MRVYDLIATNEHLDAKTGLVTYTVRAEGFGEPDQGLIVLGPLASERDMTIMNPVYISGPIEVKMKPLRVPAKKYAVGEVVAQLVVS
jgi:hypothetical protein